MSERKDKVFVLLAAFLLGVTVATGTLTQVIGHKYQHISRLSTCEKTLPRDQFCELIAVPVKKEQTL